MKRFVAMVLMCIIAIGLFGACGSDENGSDRSDAQSDTAGVTLSTEKVNFLDTNGDAVYRIVRPKDNAEVEPKASYLYKQIKNKLDVGLKNVTDAEDGTDTYEILVGDTNREESALGMDYLKSETLARYNDFVICTIGKKIVINAKSIEALGSACKYFVENYVKAEGVDGGIAYTYAVSGDFKTVALNGVSLGEFRIVRPHFNTSYLTQTEMQKLSDKMLEVTGYKLNIIEDEYADDAEYEIVVGNAKRDGVETVTDYDTYKITVSGKKVYLNGGSPYATAMAVSEFLKMLETGSVTDASSVTGSYDTAVTGYDRATTFTPKWTDDFDGNELDTSKWTQKVAVNSVGINGKYVTRSGDPQDVFVAEGKFYMCAREDDVNYYGGWIETANTMSFRYGYVEASLIMPDGDGFWSAFWTKSVDPNATVATPEIDIFECFGNSATYNVNCHSWPNGAGKAQGLAHTSLDGSEYYNLKRSVCPDDARFNSAYHTVGMLWDSEKMAFTCDGNVFFTYDTTKTEQDIATFNTTMYLNLSLAVGSASSPRPVITNDPEVWKNTNKYICEYVHIYQLDDGRQELILK